MQYNCIIRVWSRRLSSASPGSPGRRRSTASSRTPSSSSSRSVPTHSPGSPRARSIRGSPGTATGPLPRFVPNEEALAADAELVFCCLDDERAAAFEPPVGAVVVDLSGAHRIGADGWCYALPELAPPSGRLIANPGCYATAALLALAPIAGIIDPASVVVDGKSGISGAGRGLKERSHAAVVLDNVTPYAVGGHRHSPEIAQLLGFPVAFVPHVVPLRRGLVCTCYVTASEDPRPLLEASYAGSHVVAADRRGSRHRPGAGHGRAPRWRRSRTRARAGGS